MQNMIVVTAPGGYTISQMSGGPKGVYYRCYWGSMVIQDFPKWAAAFDAMNVVLGDVTLAEFTLEHGEESAKQLANALTKAFYGAACRLP